MIRDPADDEGNHCATHDPRTQNSGERAVMLRNRVQRQRNQDWPHNRSKQSYRRKGDHRDISGPEQRGSQAEESSDGGANQYVAAVEQLQQDHSDEATGGEQPPEPGHGRRAGSVRIESVVGREKLRNPVGGALLTAYVREDREEESPDQRFAKKAAIHGP